MTHSSLGWTPKSLRRLERLRGWTPEAIRRLGLRYNPSTGRVGFDVLDETGQPIGSVRYQPDPARRVSQPKMLADRGTPRQLFPPPETIGDEELAGQTIVLAEGEADAVRLWSLGLAAVAVPGAQNWRDEWAVRFSGRRWRVLVLFDCDERGRTNARRAAGSLCDAGVDVRLIDPAPHRDDGYDVTDFLAAATNPVLRRQAAELLADIASATPPFIPDLAPAAKNVKTGDDSSAEQSRHLGSRPLAEVQPRQVRWLLPGLIPLRTLTLVAGVGGLGKSTWLAGVAAQVSRGELLDGEPGDVLMVTFEDPAAEVLRPRVQASEGDLERVHEVVVEGGYGIDPICLPGDAAELHRLIAEVDARLMIIDPIIAAFHLTLDSYKDQHVRSVLAGLAQLAEAADCAITLVGHLNKTPSRDAYVRIANSVAFWNAARSVVLITEDDPSEPDLRLVAQSKANWARHRPVERHRLDSIALPGTVDPDTGAPIETSRMVFVEYATDVERDELLGGRSRDGKTDEAVRFLEQMLVGGDWHEQAGLVTLARAVGVSERTLKRAAFDELNVEHERRGYPSTTWWRLPQSGQTDGTTD